LLDIFDRCNGCIVLVRFAAGTNKTTGLLPHDYQRT
jgi:hypothetical protein